MDLLLYGSDHAAALRAAKRLGAAQVALAKARIAVYRKAANSRALLDAVPRELHGDAGYLFSKIQVLRREEKFGEAAQLMLGAPKDAARLYNVDEWWIERRLLARKMIDIGENRTAYLIARDAALPARDIYKTEQEFTAGWIALRFLTTRQLPRIILRASASEASIRPRSRVPAIGKAAPLKRPAASRRRARPIRRRRSNRPAITGNWRGRSSGFPRSN